MKKLCLLILIFIGLGTLPALAQSHLKGQRFYYVQGGVVDVFSMNKNQLGFSGTLSTGRYNRQYNAWKVSVSYLQKPLNGGDSIVSGAMRQFSLGWGYEFNLWRNAFRTHFVRGSLQPLLLYKTVQTQPKNDSTYSLTPTPSRLLLGAEAGIELELSPIVISIRQRWQPKSTVQPFYTLVSVGWRWHGR